MENLVRSCPHFRRKNFHCDRYNPNRLVFELFAENFFLCPVTNVHYRPKGIEKAELKFCCYSQCLWLHSRAFRWGYITNKSKRTSSLPYPYMLSLYWEYSDDAIYFEIVADHFQYKGYIFDVYEEILTSINQKKILRLSSYERNETTLDGTALVFHIKSLVYCEWNTEM